MAILDVLQNFGFPVFAFLVTGFACKYVYDKEGAKSDKLVDENMKRLEELTLAVNNNTVILTHLVEKFEGDNDDGK